MLYVAMLSRVGRLYKSRLAFVIVRLCSSTTTNTLKML